MNETRIEELTGAVEDLTETMKAREQVFVQSPPVQLEPHIHLPEPAPRRAYRATVLSRDADGNILSVQFDPI
jgi:hypothetical protein